MFFNFIESLSLSEKEEHELNRQHEAYLERLLPVLGPLFGLAVVLFSVWDHLIDPVNAPVALLTRIGFVLLGAPAYSTKVFKGFKGFSWPPVQRCGYIYCTHTGAMIVAVYLLKDGFLYGLAGIAGCVFIASVVALQLKTFFLVLSAPSLMFILLSAIGTPLFVFVNGMMHYLFSICLACIVMLVIRLSRQRAFQSEMELLNIARHDALTGVCNLRYLTELAEREMALAKRHERPLAIAMIDIDRFKNINDTYGHDIGDKVIKILSNTCLENLRTTDHFGRIGGEEFVWILPETATDEAIACAERLRSKVEALHIVAPQGTFQFTISIGVALLTPDHTDWSALLKDADVALYSAKQNGRNRVELAVIQPNIQPNFQLNIQPN